MTASLASITDISCARCVVADTELARARSEAEVLQSRITELGEVLTALGHPPQSLSLQLDQVACSNANAAADAITGRLLRDKVAAAAATARTRAAAARDPQRILDQLLGDLARIDQANTAQIRRNHDDSRKNVADRRARISDIITASTSP